MKKLFLLSFLSMSLILTSNAQDVIYGGFKLSPNYSIFIEKADTGDKAGVGYNIGYFEILELSNKINLQAELNYSQYSFVNGTTVGTVTAKKTEITRSIDLPIAVKYRVSDDFAVGVGYQFSRGVTGKEKMKVGSGDVLTVDKERVGTPGFFFDANYKNGKNIFGLRLLRTNDPIYTKESLNFALYVGIGIF